MKRNRHRLLRRYIPALDEDKGYNKYVHKRCLAAIGLYPYPSEGTVDLTQVINDTVAGHIRGIINQAPTNLGLQTLTLQVYEELRKIIPPPSPALGLQMRKVVAHWVIQNAPERFEHGEVTETAVVVPDEFVELDLSTGLSINQCHNHRSPTHLTVLPNSSNSCYKLIWSCCLSVHISPVLGTVRDLRLSDWIVAQPASVADVVPVNSPENMDSDDDQQPNGVLCTSLFCECEPVSHRSAASGFGSGCTDADQRHYRGYSAQTPLLAIGSWCLNFEISVGDITSTVVATVRARGRTPSIGRQGIHRGADAARRGTHPRQG
jgi:hypothetical protein